MANTGRLIDLLKHLEKLPLFKFRTIIAISLQLWYHSNTETISFQLTRLPSQVSLFLRARRLASVSLGGAAEVERRLSMEKDK